jgi:NADPH2:quinone reductase
MKAIALSRYLPVNHPESLYDIELPKPVPQGRDVLVQVAAISVNPVDVKVRAPKDKIESVPRILGWDAAGTVVEVGTEVETLKVGDHVYYMGDFTRPGTNSEFHLVDERVVARKPQSLSFAEAAALPLTALTAWEALFDRLQVGTPLLGQNGASILIVGGAGGVASIAIQIAAKIAGLTVIATASRPESIAWVRQMGAHHVVDHNADIPQQLSALGITGVDYVLLAASVDQHFQAAANVVAPQGKICAIVEAHAPLDMELLKAKSAGFIWEMVFTRTMFKTADMARQSGILAELARLVDAGILQTTVQHVLSPVNAEQLRKAHALLEEGRTIGKLVLKDF